MIYLRADDNDNKNHYQSVLNRANKLPEVRFIMAYTLWIFSDQIINYIKSIKFIKSLINWIQSEKVTLKKNWADLLKKIYDKIKKDYE